MFKKFLSMFLSLIMVISLLSVMPIVASAYTSGDYEYSVLGNGTVEITKYNGKASNLTIPSTLGGKKVTRIRDEAFKWCETLTSITIPNSVISIGDSVFLCCSKLKRISVDANNKNYSSKDGVLFNKDKTILREPLKIDSQS